MTAVDLVTGGGGFIGCHVVRALQASGGRVRVLDIDCRRGFGPDVEVINGSILDPDALAAACAGVRHVYHLAAIAHLWLADPGAYERVNHQGTRAVLRAAADAGAEKIIVTSSETILRGWNNPDPAPINEAEPRPAMADMAGAYDRSKWLADEAARQAAAAGMPVISLYPTVPVGPGDVHFTAPTRMIEAFLQGQAPAYYDCLLNLAGVEDLAQGHLLAAQQAPAGSRYILAGENLWMRDILALLAGLTGQAMPHRQVPYWLAALSAHGAEWWANHVSKRTPLANVTGVRLTRHPRRIDGGLAIRELGYRPGPARDALAQAIAWLNGQ
ncbi:MAG: NAD-dependent epimerase/dehydratase family protein [Sphingomonadales bacterium]